MRLGDRGQGVMELQRLLGVDADGAFGGKTHTALRIFQAANGLKPDGIAGPRTMAALTPSTESGSMEDVINALWGPDPMIQEQFKTGGAALGGQLETVHLSRPMEMAMFLGQVRQEVGPSFATEENLNYKAAALSKLFSYYRKYPHKAQLHGRSVTHRADQEAIANAAYANRIGNGNIKSGDGWRFRGAGMKQLTGRSNYQAYHDWLRDILPAVYKTADGDKIMEEGADLVLNSPHAFLSAVFFWDMKLLWRHADGERLMRHDVDEVTRIVNRHTDSYDARWSHTQRIYGIIS